MVLAACTRLGAQMLTRMAARKIVGSVGNILHSSGAAPHCSNRGPNDVYARDVPPVLNEVSGNSKWCTCVYGPARSPPQVRLDLAFGAIQTVSARSADTAAIIK